MLGQARWEQLELVVPEMPEARGPAQRVLRHGRQLGRLHAGVTEPVAKRLLEAQVEPFELERGLPCRGVDSHLAKLTVVERELTMKAGGIGWKLIGDGGEVCPVGIDDGCVLASFCPPVEGHEAHGIYASAFVAAA